MPTPATHPSNGLGDALVSIPEIVFSCGICQATVADVYSTKESDQGFSSRPGEHEGLVTRLWIADCAHVFCGKHLEGGGKGITTAPFHPNGTPPRAACPVCVLRGDTAPKDLFGIRGLREGEYDTGIPNAFLRCPPAALDAEDPSMDALRFQYSQLALYARNVTKSWRVAEQQQLSVSASRDLEHRRRRALQDELQQLKTRVSVLDKAEVKLQKWEVRKPMIHHYLAAVGDMAREMGEMRQALGRLGYDVPRHDYSFKPAGNDESLTADISLQQIELGEGRSVPSDPHFKSSSSSRKRRRDQDDIVEDPKRGLKLKRVNSRDIMPPPSWTLSTSPRAPPPSSARMGKTQAVDVVTYKDTPEMPRSRSRRDRNTGSSSSRARHSEPEDTTNIHPAQGALPHRSAVHPIEPNIALRPAAHHDLDGRYSSYIDSAPLGQRHHVDELISLPPRRGGRHGNPSSHVHHHETKSPTTSVASPFFQVGARVHHQGDLPQRKGRTHDLGGRGPPISPRFTSDLRSSPVRLWTSGDFDHPQEMPTPHRRESHAAQRQDLFYAAPSTDFRGRLRPQEPMLTSRAVQAPQTPRIYSITPGRVPLPAADLSLQVHTQRPRISLPPSRVSTSMSTSGDHALTRIQGIGSIYSSQPRSVRHSMAPFDGRTAPTRSFSAAGSRRRVVR